MGFTVQGDVVDVLPVMAERAADEIRRLRDMLYEACNELERIDRGTFVVSWAGDLSDWWEDHKPAKPRKKKRK